MGLDMYLERMPRYKDVTVKQIMVTRDYFEWIKEKEAGNEYANCTFKQWCGHDFDELPSIEAIEFFRQFYKATYSEWDTEKKHPWYRIHEEVGYWRKANHIHLWFVNNVQDGIDDCCYHHEVTKELLEELRDTCIEVLNNSVTMLGKVKNGAHYDKDSCSWVDDLEIGQVVINPEVARDLLPTTSGFFFGGIDYDEWYLRDVKNTIAIINKVLDTTDFEKEMIYYVSSW